MTRRRNGRSGQSWQLDPTHGGRASSARGLTRCRAALVLGMLALSGTARAEPPTPQPSATAWLDASPDDQQAARALFIEGRRLFARWQLIEAEGRYRAALARWRHPIIYFYLSQVREQQGDLVDAYENLHEALRHEPVPFSAEERRLAGALREGLEARLARIEVACEQAGAEVWLDGELWFRGGCGSFRTKGMAGISVG